MKRMILLVLVLLLSACTGGCSEIAAMRAGAAAHGANAADQALETALWTICNATPVGAIKRRFKTREERAAYDALCPEGLLPPGEPVEGVAVPTQEPQRPAPRPSSRQPIPSRFPAHPGQGGGLTGAVRSGCIVPVRPDPATAGRTIAVHPPPFGSFPEGRRVRRPGTALFRQSRDAIGGSVSCSDSGVDSYVTDAFSETDAARR